MSNLPNSFLHVLDANGDVYSGALLYTYQGGTTTPRQTFSNRALTSANANPVVADSAGRFGEIYLTPGVAYKLLLKTSAGVTVWTDDDVYALENTANGLTTRIGQIASNPLSYGAVGDGVADETTEVQAAIDAATGVVDLLGKTYRCDNALSLASGLTLRNGTLDFSNCEDSSYVSAAGTIGDALLLSGNAAIGASSVGLASVTGLAAGDILSLYSDGVYFSTLKLGELVQIDRIDGTTVYLKNTLQMPYATADNAAVKKITAESDIKIENVTINCSTAVTASPTAVKFSMCHHVRITNVYVNQCKVTSFGISGCLDVALNGCRADEDAGSGYGFSITSGSRDVRLYDCEANRVSRGVNIGGASVSVLGPVMFTTVDQCRFNGCTTGIYSTAYSFHLRVLGSIITAGELGTTGVYTMGADTWIDGNRIEKMSSYGVQLDMDAITVAVNPVGFKIRNNYFDTCATYGVYCAATSQEKTDIIEIDGNTFDACPTGVYFKPGASSGDFDYLSFCGNKFYGVTGYGIYFHANKIPTENITCNGNIVGVSAGGTGLYFDGDDVAKHLVVGANVVSGAGDVCIHVIDSENVSIHANTCITTTADKKGIVVAGNVTTPIDRLSVAGNAIDSSAGTTSVGIEATYCGRICVNGNTVESSGKGVSLLEISSGSVGNNSVEPSIELTQTAVASTGLSFVGNSVYNPDGHGIDLTCLGDTGIVVSGNTVKLGASLGGHCIAVDGSVVGLVISGNHLNRQADQDDNIALDGSGAGAIDQVAIVGNICVNGDYGVGEATDANNTNVMAIGNIFLGMNSGVFQGTIDNELAADDHNAT